jgi:8-oxo-dGTP diphosphatase
MPWADASGTLDGMPDHPLPVREMTAMFIHDDERVLLLHREGSRVIGDSWVGIGGHVETGETADAAALREVEEEVALSADDLRNIRLRYTAVRDTGQERRIIHYFSARLTDTAHVPTGCSEGTLRWFDLRDDLSNLLMPPTARIVFDHWQSIGRFDDELRQIVVSPS